jgi:hypothetical protein
MQALPRDDLTHRLRRMIARSFSSLPAISRSAPCEVGR